MLLIHPPISKPCEPPAGVGRLSGALRHYNIRHKVLDANLEALLYAMNKVHAEDAAKTDRWTLRAFRNVSGNISALRGWSIYNHIDRYGRAVMDLNRAFRMSVNNGITLSLADYHHDTLSPLRSSDLIRAAEMPETNPFYPYFKKRFSEFALENDLTTAGFSLNYLSQALCTFAMIGYLRKEFPTLVIVLGGGLVTSWAKNPEWKNPFKGLVDHLVAGPGEKQLLSVLGIEEIQDDHFPPYYGGLPLHDYLSPGPILPYSASSGCYWRKCSFCPETTEGNPYGPVQGSKVVRDLDAMISRTDPVMVHFLDNSMNPALLKRLAEGPFSVPWYGFTRIDSLLADTDFCRDLRRSGCVMLKIGLESGDQGVLDRLQKGIDLEMASAVLKALKKAGIAAYVYLLFGTPQETLSGARKTLEFVVRHKGEIDFLNLAVFNMPVCSPEADTFSTRKFYEGDLSLYADFSHPHNWNRKQVRQFLDREFRKNRAVAEILKNDPPVFTSNHAPLFIMQKGDGEGQPG